MEEICERFSNEPLHDHVGHFFFGESKVVDLDDIAMFDRGSHARFTQETLRKLAFLRCRAMKELHGDSASERDVLGLPYGRHAAFADLVDQSVAISDDVSYAMRHRHSLVHEVALSAIVAPRTRFGQPVLRVSLGSGRRGPPERAPARAVP